MQQLTMVSKTTDADGHVTLEFDDGTNLWFDTEQSLLEYTAKSLNYSVINELLRQCAVRCVSEHPAHGSCIATWDDADASGHYVTVVEPV